MPGLVTGILCEENMVPLYNWVIRNVANQNHEDVTGDITWYEPIRTSKSTAENPCLEVENASVFKVCVRLQTHTMLKERTLSSEMYTL
jgi:hypothetical protein